MKRRFWRKGRGRFVSSNNARKGTRVKFLGESLDNKKKRPVLSQKEYCDLRNFLFIYILSQNGHRSGVLTNSTLAEYNKMTHVDGTCIVAVKDHKTFSCHGQANLCFEDSVKAWVDIYVECARSQVDPGNESD